MPTAIDFKSGFDLMRWRSIANAPNAAAAGVTLSYDHRNTEDRHPEIFQLASLAAFNKYNIKNDDWMPLASPALAGTFGAGVDSVFVPEAGPAGTLAAGATTASVVLSTALPAAVGVNQLANRGDGRGFKIRIVGNSAGGSGKIEERIITGNTSGTTPTIYLDSALSFTPASGDRYEILSGRVFLLSAGTLAAGVWKYYDIATNSFSGSLATTNLPATIGTDSDLLSLSELYVPNVRKPGEGFLIGAGTYNNGLLGCLTATAITSTTITGQATGGDAAVLANEYRNFQIRIVEDTATPTAVGQRRNITSHTAGASPVYTVPAWAVTPSATAKFVIEGNGDRILLWTSANTVTYTYSIAGNAWDAGTTFANKTSIVGAGVSAVRAFGIVPDTAKLCRHSYIFVFRGGGSNAIDVFDIAGATTGLWTENINYGNKSQTFTTGNSVIIDPIANEGRFAYINVNGTQRFARFDMKNLIIEPLTWLEYTQGAAIVGTGLALITFIDPGDNTKITSLIHQRRSNVECFRLDIMR